MESNNIYQVGVYQEFARDYGIFDYKNMFENFKANSVRLKTASEYKNKGIGNDEFGNSLLRNIFVALYLSVKAENTIEGRNYLRSTYDANNEYWNKRSIIMNILEFLSRLENIVHMKHWHKDSYYAKLLKEAIKNDGI